MEDLLIIDDSKDILKQLKWGLGADYSIHTADNASEGLALCSKYVPKVVILDLGLPPHEDSTEEGFRCLKEILATNSLAKVIVVTGQSDRENALKAIQLGAYDFYQKPINLKELKVIIQRALYLRSIEDENRNLLSCATAASSRMGGIIGQCQAMIKVFSTVERVSSTDVPILITGESGTGKEVIARAVHSLSLRGKGPFIPINCGAIPENLLEAELFGYERGAFTGAHAQVLGKVEYAHNGTLFLDEIAELSPSLQAKLLRFLQDKTIQRVGGREDINVNARIVAATNIDIQKAIKDGEFREDLYYRIGVISLHLPPLRDRSDDILLIANYYLKRFSESMSKNVKGFSSASIEYLKHYEWPGNVREIENRIQSAVIMSDTAFIEPHDLGFYDKTVDTKTSSSKLNLKTAKDMVEKDILSVALGQHDGNMSRIAEALGISRPTLYDLMKKHGLGDKVQQK
jgi:two-component system, NtrC family, response regulator